MNAPNADFSVSNEHVNTDSSTSSTIVTNNAETISSQRSTSNNITTVSELNALNQSNIEIIDVDDNSMTSNNQSIIDYLMLLGNVHQCVASHNAAQQNAHITSNRGKIIGGIQDLSKHFCVYETRKLLYCYLNMHNLPYAIFDGTNIRTSPPKEGRPINILCIGLGFS